MGPFKCPDCGVWWASIEHRCRYPVTPTAAGQYPNTQTFGHCHGCSSAVCPLPDNRPCNLHISRTTM
jgi:hypothetical protein